MPHWSACSHNLLGPTMRLQPRATPFIMHARITAPVGERSHTVHAYWVNTLASEVFTRVNTPSWQVFTHLP
eukprot:5974948-Prymnesium_polylepis.1